MDGILTNHRAQQRAIEARDREPMAEAKPLEQPPTGAPGTLEHRARSNPKPLSERPGHSLLMVRLIAVFKFLKAASLLIIGIFILRVLHLHDKTIHEILVGFVNDLRLDENNHFIHGLLEKSFAISPVKWKWLSSGTLIYAILYFTEGMGLWFDQAWAEVMTIITTAGFIPLEIMEILKDPTPVRIIVFVMNVLLLIYICLRLRWRRQARKEGVDVKTNPRGIGH
ncbi:MAG: DUF2127 domain-containing protein [Phycisphaerae bacterium]